MSATFDGEEYQARFDRLAESGADVHGEADFVCGLEPATVLDAGCGTGRVGIELQRRGIEVVGIDVDEGMLDVARRRAPDVDWRHGDLATVRLEPDRFDVVLMAGNVVLFTEPGSEAAVVANLATAIRPGGALVAGFSIRPGGYDLDRYDADCAAAGLALADRWSTWDRRPATDDPTYAVSVHRRR